MPVEIQKKYFGIDTNKMFIASTFIPRFFEKVCFIICRKEIRNV